LFDVAQDHSQGSFVGNFSTSLQLLQYILLGWRAIRASNHFFLAVLAARLKLAAVGAPALPGFRIFSPEPFLIRIRFAWMLA
jgi:hypothetical protein